MFIDPGKETLSRVVQDADWSFMSPQVKKLVESPSFFLQMATYAWEKGLGELLADLDLTNTQFKMLASLVLLNKDRQVVTQMDIANRLGADKTMVSEVLRTLEKKGFIIREEHPLDRRAKSLTVTEKGFEVFEIAVKRAVEFNETFFAPLGKGRKQFTSMLKKLR